MKKGMESVFTGVFLGVLSLFLVFHSPACAGHVTLPAVDVGSIQNPSVENDARLLLRFELPADLSNGGTVELGIVEFRAAVTCPDTTGALTVNAVSTTRPWDGQNVEWDEEWESLSEIGSSAGRSVWPVASGESALLRFDVTEFVRDCLSGEAGSLSVMAAIANEELGAFLPHCIGGGVTEIPELMLWYTPARAASNIGG